MRKDESAARPAPTRRRVLTAARDCSLTLAAFGAAGLLAPVAAQPTSTASTAPALLVVGDSLSAEYGIARGSGWVALLDARLRARGAAWSVVNASVSGDTTSGGVSRLPALLERHRPRVVVVELGGNDALRGLPLAQTEKNLVTMTRAARAAGARVLLVGMQVPPNYGRSYASDFNALFARVAKSEGASLVPFLLAGFADAPDAERWFQPDRIHPLASAHPKMLDTVWPTLAPLLESAGVAKAR